MACFNRNSQEYKSIESKYGKSAHFILNAMGVEDNIPTIRQVDSFINRKKKESARTLYSLMRSGSSYTPTQIASNLKGIIHKHNGQYFITKGASMNEFQRMESERTIFEPNLKIMRAFEKQFPNVFTITKVGRFKNTYRVDINTPTGKQGKLFSLGNDLADKTIKLDNVLRFLENIDVSIEFADFGDNPEIALANFENGVIEITSNIDKRPTAWLTLPEEAAHFWFRRLKADTQLGKQLLSDLKEFYPDVLEEVRKDYKDKYDNEMAFEEEAVGKMIARVINEMETTPAKLNWWERFVKWVKSLYTKPEQKQEYPESFQEAAKRIITSDLSDMLTQQEYEDMMNASQGYMYKDENTYRTLDNGYVGAYRLSQEELEQFKNTFLDNPRYRLRKFLTKKTLGKIVVSKSTNTKLFRELTESNKEEIIENTKVDTLTPSLFGFSELRKKYKNKIDLKSPIKLNGVKKEELSLLNNIRTIILEEIPELKSISIDDFIEGVEAYLGTNHSFMFTWENRHLNYRVKNTFTNPEGVQHQKISIRYNNKYVDRQSHFALSPVAWGNLTNFKDGALIHEIQSDFYENMVEISKSKTQDVKASYDMPALIETLNPHKFLSLLVQDLVRNSEITNNLISERINEYQALNNYTIDDLSSSIGHTKSLIDTLNTYKPTAKNIVKELIKSKTLKEAFDYNKRKDVDVIEALDSLKSTLKVEIRQILHDKYNIPHQDELMLTAMLFSYLGHRRKYNINFWLSEKGVDQLFNMKINENFESYRKLLFKQKYLNTIQLFQDVNRAQPKMTLEVVNRLKRNLDLSREHFNFISKELEKNYKPIDLSTELNYFTHISHKLIQEHIKQNGKETPLYFSGYEVTKLTQGSEQTAKIYAGPEEVKKGLTDKVGPLYTAMKKVKGIKLEYVDEIPGIGLAKYTEGDLIDITFDDEGQAIPVYADLTNKTKLSGGYKINLENYNFKTPLLFSLGTTESGMEISDLIELDEYMMLSLEEKEAIKKCN